MTVTQSGKTCTHYCERGATRDVAVVWDHDARCYVQQEPCPDCGSMFELYVGVSPEG